MSVALAQEWSTSTMDNEPSYDLRIFLRSGNVVEIDQVTKVEWDKTRMKIEQRADAMAFLFMPTLDITQIEAIVRLERCPD
jgi:hypothetical protein